MLRRHFWISMLAMAAISSPLWGDPQDNAPTTLPSVDRVANHAQLEAIEKSLAKLNDPDPQIRQGAHDALMQLHHADLPLLRDVVSRQANLAPEQLAALQDVVIQLFLQSDEMPSPPVQGFLGLHWSSLHVGVPGSDLGVIVEDRIPGFAAYKALQPGDIILELVDHPEIDVRDRNSFVSKIATMHAGDPVRMKVARAGRVIDATIVLNPRPADLADQNFDLWVAQRRQAALDFWNQQFTPILHQPAAT